MPNLDKLGLTTLRQHDESMSFQPQAQLGKSRLILGCVNSGRVSTFI